MLSHQDALHSIMKQVNFTSEQNCITLLFTAQLLASARQSNANQALPLLIWLMVGSTCFLMYGACLY